MIRCRYRITSVASTMPCPVTEQCRGAPQGRTRRWCDNHRRVAVFASPAKPHGRWPDKPRFSRRRSTQTHTYVTGLGSSLLQMRAASRATYPFQCPLSPLPFPGATAIPYQRPRGDAVGHGYRETYRFATSLTPTNLSCQYISRATTSLQVFRRSIREYITLIRTPISTFKCRYRHAR